MMAYSKDCNEWLLIRAKTGNWFSKDALAFWGSKIYWGTLKQVGTDYFFISQEDNFNQSEKLFSIRKVNKDFGIETLEFQFTADFKAAKSKLKEILADA
jgi:hypothetical protein